MITVTMRRRADGLELTAAGHAGMAERGGDIVCAGVSALLFGYVAYVEGDRAVLSAWTPSVCEVFGRGGVGRVSRRMGDGELWVRTRGMRGADRAAWDVTAAGLALIADRHPDRVRLNFTLGKQKGA